MRFANGSDTGIRGNLKLKLSLCLVPIIGLAVILASWTAVKMEERQLLLVAQEHLEALQELLPTVVRASMLARDRENVQKVIEALGSHDEIANVSIFDSDGLIHFSSRREDRGRRVGTEELTPRADGTTAVMRGGGPAGLTYTMVQPMLNEPECFSCHAPEQTVLGMLRISISPDPTRRQIALLKRLAVGATVITLGMIVGVIWFALTFLLDRPLRRLVAVMAQAGRGDLGVRADARGNDEIGRLARRFNSMLSQLQVAQDRMKRSHREKLARADRLATVGEMAATLAHEIRNPLAALQGIFSALGRDVGDNEKREKTVRDGGSLVVRINKAIEDMLRYARPSLPHLRPVKFEDIVDRSLSLIESEAREAGVRLVKEAAAAGAGGEDGGALTVRADPEQMLQVLVNIARNAVQACSRGGEVRVRTFRRTGSGDRPLACVEVEDNGKGMTADELDQVFNPYFTTKLRGTGLGLPIAEQILGYHDGRISLTSTPDQGTRVEVELPAHVDSPSRG